MAANLLPLDDLELETEEVEGLIEVSTVGRGKKKASISSTAAAEVAGLCNSRYRGRWGCLLLVVSAVVAILWFADTSDLQAAVGMRGSHVSDVEGKNVTEPVNESSVANDEGAKEGSVPATSPPAKDATETTDKKDTSATTDASPETPAKDTTATVPDEPATATTSAVTGDSKLPKPYTVITENPPSPAVLEEYAKTWGTWQLGELPKMDRDAFCGTQSHCDVPRDKFPPNAWQSDSAYMEKFLDEADKLVDRAMHAILAEYGKEPTDSAMFDLSYKDFGRRDLGKGPPDNGGWTTKRSMQGLARRLLHAIMTRDTFTLIMGGHSAAAGHGNHFKQSYTMQFHKVMEPVMSYLGVELISRNLAQGGLGTAQSSLGAADIYGDEIDFMVWDSSMTEGRDGPAVDLFGRQALMGHRVPVLWSLNENFLQLYHDKCDADVGLHGTADVGIPVTKDASHAATLPYAAQYMKCDAEINDLCREHKYAANCWVERPDVTPPTKQMDRPGGQASWHPGNRYHQLIGRILAYTVLTGLKEAIGIWKKADGKLLPDEDWHVTAYYDNIRNKVMNLDPTLGSCYGYEGRIPTRMCKLHMRGRTEFTPRADPEKTSIRSILKTSDHMPTVREEILYDGPDVRNPMFDIPEGDVDVLAILNNGRKFPEASRRLSTERRAAEEIVPGKGISLEGHPGGYCDGSYNTICKRNPSDGCLLYGHHDSRADLNFNELSGWVVLEVPKVKHGLIAIKMETWHFADENSITKEWTTVNNERHLRHGQAVMEEPEVNYMDVDTGMSYVEGLDDRRLGKRQQIPYSDDFHFEFSVDGKMTSYNRTQFEPLRESGNIQRVVEVFTMLDDPDYVKNGEEKDIEVAFRMTGGHGKAFGLTHVYWA